MQYPKGVLTADRLVAGTVQEKTALEVLKWCTVAEVGRGTR